MNPWRFCIGFNSIAFPVHVSGTHSHAEVYQSSDEEKPDIMNADMGRASRWLTQLFYHKADLQGRTDRLLMIDLRRGPWFLCETLRHGALGLRFDVVDVERSLLFGGVGVAVVVVGTGHV